MDFDATIERLNALKLQERGSNQQLTHTETTQLQLELRRLQEENARRVQEQERTMQRWQHEMRELQTRLEAAEHQNKLLKAALGEVDTYRQETETQQLVIEELQTQVKQLRLTNYRLQIDLEPTEEPWLEYFKNKNARLQFTLEATIVDAAATCEEDVMGL